MSIQVDIQHDATNDVDGQLGGGNLHAEEIVLLGVLCHNLTKDFGFLDDGGHLRHEMGGRESGIEGGAPTFPYGTIFAHEIGGASKIGNEFFDERMFRIVSVNDLVQHFDVENGHQGGTEGPWVEEEDVAHVVVFFETMHVRLRCCVSGLLGEHSPHRYERAQKVVSGRRRESFQQTSLEV